jgi:hypothetical protein
MGRYALINMILKYACVLLSLLLFGCQSKLDEVGQEHAKEVVKWQELAHYAGNELKYLGLTVTAGVQINQNADEISYSIVKVQLNRNSNHTEIDLLSPEFAEKFACGKECQKLGLYDSNFIKQETQLTSFFFTEEGRFFEFYGRLTRLNNTLADYRASAPAILEKYLTLMLNRKLVFNSLSEFADYIENHLTEEKLLAFSKSGFVSPVEDRLSSTFLDDLTINLPKDWNIDDLVNDFKEPSNDWSSNVLTPDELLIRRLIGDTPTADAINQNWQQAKQYAINVGSIACSFSDNTFGVVKGLKTDTVSLEVIAQARVLVDGMKLYPPPGYLFTAPESFNFVKNSLNETYPLSDVATCNIEHLKRGQG